MDQEMVYQETCRVLAYGQVVAHQRWSGEHFVLPRDRVAVSGLTDFWEMANQQAGDGWVEIQVHGLDEEAVHQEFEDRVKEARDALANWS